MLILLDLRVAEWSGLAFLEAMRKTYDRRVLPVVVLSGSGVAADVDRAFELGANSSPIRAQLADLVGSLATARCSELPTGKRSP